MIRKKLFNRYERPRCFTLNTDAELVFCDPSMSEGFEQDNDYDDWD